VLLIRLIKLGNRLSAQGSVPRIAYYAEIVRSGGGGGSLLSR
jgi:hypothetical protein